MKKKFIFIFLGGALLVGLFIIMFPLSNEVNEGFYYDYADLFSCDAEIDSGESQIDCTIEDWYDGKKKAVCFTWDDCNHGIKGVSKIFDNHGLRTTFFVNTAIINDWYVKVRLFYKGTINKVLTDVLKNGHEVSSHTHNHKNLTKLTLEQVEDEFIESSNTIHKMYGYYPTTLSHPESNYNEQIDSLMHLYYVDSRYSSIKDKDSTIRYLHIRTSYPFGYYKKNFDSFIESASNLYVFGGHQIDGVGYQPINSGTLDSLLTYITVKYGDLCWITTFEDMTFYKIIRDNVRIVNEGGRVQIDISSIDSLLNKYTHPHAYLTLRFKNANLDFASSGIIRYRYDGVDSYCTIDLRKATVVDYQQQDSTFIIQKPKRNGL